MANTTAQEVYDSFEATFSDKKIIPTSLELQWLKMSVAKYNAEIAVDTLLTFDSNFGQFNAEIDQYVISVLVEMMKVFYLEREISRVDKISSIVSKDISVNGTNGLQKYTHEEIIQCKYELSQMLSHLKTTAYS